MSFVVLQQLLSDDFAVAVGFHSNPAGMRRRLARMPEIAAVRRALDEGALTEESIGRFVSGIMADFRRGEHFAHEDALSALCIALETRPTDFAEEFLRDLASLKVAELSLAIRVARECRRHRAAIAPHVARTLDLLPREGNGDSLSLVAWECGIREIRCKRTNVAALCEVQ
jgi:hypothetical protein